MQDNPRSRPAAGKAFDVRETHPRSGPYRSQLRPAGLDAFGNGVATLPVPLPDLRRRLNSSEASEAQASGRTAVDADNPMAYSDTASARGGQPTGTTSPGFPAEGYDMQRGRQLVRDNTSVHTADDAEGTCLGSGAVEAKAFAPVQDPRGGSTNSSSGSHLTRLMHPAQRQVQIDRGGRDSGGNRSSSPSQGGQESTAPWHSSRRGQTNARIQRRTMGLADTADRSLGHSSVQDGFSNSSRSNAVSTNKSETGTQERKGFVTTLFSRKHKGSRHSDGSLFFKPHGKSNNASPTSQEQRAYVIVEKQDGAQESLLTDPPNSPSTASPQDCPSGAVAPPVPPTTASSDPVAAAGSDKGTSEKLGRHLNTSSAVTNHAKLQPSSSSSERISTANYLHSISPSGEDHPQLVDGAARPEAAEYDDLEVPSRPPSRLARDSPSSKEHGQGKKGATSSRNFNDVGFLLLIVSSYTASVEDAKLSNRVASALGALHLRTRRTIAHRHTLADFSLIDGDTETDMTKRRFTELLLEHGKNRIRPNSCTNGGFEAEMSDLTFVQTNHRRHHVVIVPDGLESFASSSADLNLSPAHMLAVAVRNWSEEQKIQECKIHLVAEGIGAVQHDLMSAHQARSGLEKAAQQDPLPAALSPSLNANLLADAQHRGKQTPQTSPSTRHTLNPTSFAPQKDACTAAGKGRGGRPALMRLDTSERIKQAASSPRSAPRNVSASRLTLNVGAAKSPVGESSPNGLGLKVRAGTVEAGITSPKTSENRSPAMRGGSEPTGEHPEAKAVLGALLRAPMSPTRSFSVSSGTALSASFEPSEILSNFLYLGPEIATLSEANYLKQRFGIRRIVNAAYEIDDGGGRHLSLGDDSGSGFEKYKKVPLKDSVEAKGVQHHIDEACAFLDDARLHSAPTYVHCKAGKSRSVMLVMAYLIHSNRWSLRKSYAYVVERRRDVSPNIGFVAELMAFEERCLGSVDGRKTAAITSGARATAAAGATILDTSEATHAAGRARDQTSETHRPPALTPPPQVHLQGLARPHERSSTSRSGSAGSRLPRKALKSRRPATSESSRAPNSTAAHPAEQTSATEGADLSTHAAGSKLRFSQASGEFRGADGRYHVRRPPADEQTFAPSRRTTVAAVGSENPFAPHMAAASKHFDAEEPGINKDF